MREVPGTPPAWHEVHPGLWVGDGRHPPGEDFDLVVTLDAGEAMAALGVPRDELVELLQHRRNPRALTNRRFADHLRDVNARP